MDDDPGWRLLDPGELILRDLFVEFLENSSYRPTSVWLIASSRISDDDFPGYLDGESSQHPETKEKWNQ